VECTGVSCIKLPILLLIDSRGFNWRQSTMTKFANTTMMQMIDENMSCRHRGGRMMLDGYNMYPVYPSDIFDTLDANRLVYKLIIFRM
jgi:hypothetical protein